MKPVASILPNVIPSVEFTEAQRAEMREELRLKDDRERIEYEEGCWINLCGKIYAQPFDYSQHKPGNHVAIRSIIEWKNYPRGLFLVGPTGMGKTRACWAAIKPHWSSNWSVAGKTSFQLAQDAVIAMTDAERAPAIMRQYTESHILFLDDLGKRLTPSACQFLFEVIERRTRNERVIVATSNQTMETLAQAIGDITMAEPIIRRLQEFCDVEVLR